MGRNVLAFSLVTMAALAGCADGSQVIGSASLADVNAVAGRIVTFGGGEILPTDARFADLAMRIAPTGFLGPEPTLGVLADGTIFTTAHSTERTAPPMLARSTDDGGTWSLLGTGDIITSPKASLDAWMWIDPYTQRIIHAPLYVACSWMTWSDDAGETWDVNPVTGCAQGIPAHDHQKITTGPPAEGVRTTGYPNVLYYSYNSLRKDGTWIAQSYDGGRTFTLGQIVHPASCHSGIAGPVAVGDDGVAYSPKPTCDGIAIAVTKDSGATWSTVHVDDAGSIDALAAMTDAAVDRDLNAYATWTGKNGLPFMTRTIDAGSSWSEPVRVSPPDITASTHNVIIAGDAGRVAVAYLGTRADTSRWPGWSAQDADPTARWHLFLSITEDALAPSPVWTSIQVTPEDDPVQVGQIWLSGGSARSRNLLDFIDMVQHDGRIYIGYADGCAKCDKDTDSRGSEATVAFISSGPSLHNGSGGVPVSSATARPHLLGVSVANKPIRQ